jgi:predicted PurR-regulated permease PerM
VDTNVSQFSRTWRFVVGAAALGITLLILREFAGFVNTLVIAIILAVLFMPFLLWLERKGLPFLIAFIITMAIVVLIIFGLLLFLVFSFSQLNETIPLYAEEMEQLIDNFKTNVIGSSAESAAVDSALELIDPARLLEIIGQFVGGLIDVFSDTVFVLLTLAFLLIGSKNFNAKTERLIKAGNTGFEKLYQFNQDIRRYIVITNNMGMLVGVVNTIVLALIGVDFAILWGILSWLLSYIPFIGFLLAMIPPALLALLEFGWPAALLVIVAYVLINSAMDDVIKPRIMGEGLNLAPVIVFISVIFWGLILGPLGGILAVPATVAIKQLLLVDDPQFSWIADMMSAGEVEVDSGAEGETAAV